VDYIVYIPVDVPMELVNKYGNVYMTDHQGTLKLDLSNGDFKAGSLSGESNIMLEFGNITVNSIQKGRLDLGYAEMVLKQAGTIHISGRSSKCWITAADALDLDSRRDKFYIDTLRSLTGECNFSMVQISLLDRSGVLRTNFGDIKINGTAAGLTGINLNSAFTDVLLCLPQTMTYALVADYKKTTFTLPMGVTGIQSKLLDEKTQQYQVSGTIGSGTTPTANLLLNAEGGSITILSK
jgi:hypothetical protein